MNANVNRPKRSNRGQPAYDQTKRRKTGHTRRVDKSVRYIGDGKGKGKLTLTQAVEVGRVCIVRMTKAEVGQRDAGRPASE